MEAGQKEPRKPRKNNGSDKKPKKHRNSGWEPFRSVQQHKQRKQGWQLPLLDPGDWEAQLRKHFRGIFNKSPSSRK